MTIISIGRGDDNDVVLDDPSVSLQHATIGVLAAGMYRVTDIGSEEGTFVRERRQWVRFKEYDVAGHDRVKFGECVVSVAELVPASEAPTAANPPVEAQTMVAEKPEEKSFGRVGAPPPGQEQEGQAVRELRQAAREMSSAADSRETEPAQIGGALRLPAKAAAGFAVVTVSVVIIASMLTGGSARERFLSWCGGGSARTSATCNCQVDILQAKLSDGEIGRMMDIIETANTSSNRRAAKQRLGRRILTGTLVNERVSKAVLQSAKACLPK
ncbi:MAG: FHA domain-containing protein [Alphaproteobacteria bacterium]